MINYAIATSSELLKLAAAVPGDTATLESSNVSYMKNETLPSSDPGGWQIPAINIGSASELFAAGDAVPGVSVNGSTGTQTNASLDSASESDGSQVIHDTLDSIYQFYGEEGPGSSITVKINSKRYAVSAVTLNAGHNQLPTIALVIDGKVADSGDLPAKPRKPTLAEINDVRTELMTYIYNADVTVGLYMVIESRNDPQLIEVKEWVLAGVGNTSISRNGSYSLSVLATHPLVMADTVHTTLFNNKNIQEPAEFPSESNIHLKTVAALTSYLELMEGEDNFIQSDEAGVDFSGFPDRIAKAIAVLKDKVEWRNRGGSNLPIFPNIESGAGEDITEYFDDMLWRLVIASSSGNHSPLNILKMFTQPDRGFGLGLDGSFSDSPITLSPQVFWGEPTCDIYDDEISDLLCPGESSYPIAGVICPYPMQSSANSYDFYPTSNGDERVDTCGAYIKPAQQGEVGPVYRIYLPSWLSGYPSYAASSSTRIFEVDRGSSYYGAADEVQDADQYWEGYESISSAWAENRFKELYGSGKRCTMQLRLMVNNPNFNTFKNQVLPGENVRLLSRVDGTVLFYFYILQVSHVIDAQKGTAYSNVIGAYIRPPEGIPAADISESDVEDGLENILYGAKGGLRG